ncbi:thioesterase family protein [Patulibacter sp. SYSU D01012]|uniref:acyl-CoA thioesterase n=1 Tax=Patulibacter sp. SYSU D01012 TaxID=2817381 RepID=UPI001B304473
MTGTAPVTPATTAFARATAVRSLGDGRYRAEVGADWSAPTGPNGGYLAAILVRALEGELAPEGERRLRSLTVHYLRTAALGSLEIDVRVLRTGRRTASAAVSARQDGRDVLAGLAAFAAPGLDAAATWTPAAPDVPAPPAPDAPAVRGADYRPGGGAWLEAPPGTPSISRQLRMAPVLGTGPFVARPLDGDHGVETGGWIASPEAQPVDAAYVAQLTDFWWPPAFEVLERPAIAPTIDLTIHLRADLPPGGLPPTPVLGTYRSTAAVDGLVEEDATLVLPDGSLLAQARQLALLAPLS